MYKILSLFFIFLTVSCQYFDAKVPDEETLYNQELKKINWSEVDQYPSIFQCNTIKDVLVQKQCFFDNLIKIIQERIGIDTLQLMYPEVDTIDVKVTINADATLHFEAEQPQDSVAYDFVKIDSILKNRLSDFPKVEPAIKRGMKVKTQFVVPVIIKVTE